MMDTVGWACDPLVHFDDSTEFQSNLNLQASLSLIFQILERAFDLTLQDLPFINLSDSIP